MKKIPEDKLKKMIRKILDIIKPKDVLYIEFKLDEFYGDDYYISLDYVVPDKNEVFKSLKNSDELRTEWNRTIKKSLQDILDIRVIIGSSGITSETYYNKLKDTYYAK